MIAGKAILAGSDREARGPSKNGPFKKTNRSSNSSFGASAGCAFLANPMQANKSALCPRFAVEAMAL